MPQQFGFNVSISQHCDHSEFENETGEPYCHTWSESFSNSLESVTKATQYPDVTAIHDLQVGDIGYLVWADWSTGDSFGHGDRSAVESFGLFNNEADALALQYALEHAKESDSNDWNERHKFTWTSSEGQVVESGFLPWFGYFESLDNVYVERVTIGG